MSKPELESGLTLHGPLFERFAQLSDERGGGSMTGIVLVEGEVQEEDAAAAAARNLAHHIHSVVDHAIHLNVRTSVSENKTKQGHLSVYLSIIVSVYLSVCHSVCLSAYLSVCLSLFFSFFSKYELLGTHISTKTYTSR